MKKRSSILLYFDNYHLVSSLPDDQFALLFRALLDFSELEVNGGGADLLSFPDHYPGMGEKTVGFFYFMADNVRRDALAYNEKRANYKAAAQRRREVSPPFVSSPQAAARPAPPLPERELAPISPEDMPPYIQEFLAKKQRRPQEAASAESHNSV